MKNRTKNIQNAFVILAIIIGLIIGLMSLTPVQAPPFNHSDTRVSHLAAARIIVTPSPRCILPSVENGNTRQESTPILCVNTHKPPTAWDFQHPYYGPYTPGPCVFVEPDNCDDI